MYNFPYNTNKTFNQRLNNDPNQENVIFNKNFHNNQKLIEKKPTKKENEKFDIYKAFLESRNILTDNKNFYETYYIHFDSKYRTKNITMSYGINITTNNNSLSFLDFDVYNTYITYKPILTVYCDNSDINMGDKISMTNVLSPPYTIQFKQNLNSINKGFAINVGSNIMKIYFPHGIYTYNISQNVINQENLNVYVLLNNAENIGNIPNEYINKIHKLYLFINEDKTTMGTDFFYIYLDKNLTTEIPTGTTFYFNLQFNTLCNITYSNGNIYNQNSCVPINELNSGENYTEKISKYYFDVIDSDTDTSGNDYIKLSINTSPIVDPSGKWTFGTNKIIINKITQLNQNYPDQNDYSIQLDRTYYNVISLRLVNSNFISSQQLIRSNTKKNNMLYWQNIDDGGTIYSISIPSGNYDCSTLATTMMTLINNVKRITFLPHNAYENTFNNMSITFNNITNIASFYGYRWANIPIPLKAIYPDTQTINTSNGTTNITVKYLVIYYPNHNINMANINQTTFVESNYVKIENSISFNRVPTNVINGLHVAYKIPVTFGLYNENDYFMIQLSSYNDTTENYTNGGGNAIKIYILNKMRLLFNYTDTIGNIIGFRYCGTNDAITVYDYVITNTTLYFIDKDLINYGIVKNNLFNFFGDRYILIYCDQLHNIKLPDGLNIINKISLNQTLDTENIDTFTGTTKIFVDPINEVSMLSLKFFSPDGTLYDFNNIDHSFVIEIITINETLDETHISGKHGKTLFASVKL